MARVQSKVTRLPPEARELVGTLLKNGRTLDEIMVKLRELDLPELPSRSGLGRWAKQHGAIVEEMQRQAAIGEALVTKFGQAGDNRTARLNIAMAQGLLTRLMFTEDGQIATLDAKEAMFLAGAIKDLVSASKSDTDREMKIRDIERKLANEQAATAVERVSKAEGLSAPLIAKLKSSIFGKEAV
jgi:hypothetical protein